MSDVTTRDHVIVMDIQMPFKSMVVFMVKWAIAAIPAFLVLAAIGVMFWSVMFGALFSAGTVASLVAPRTGPAALTKPATGPSSAEASAYLAKMTIVGLALGGTGKTVHGEVKNNGDRTLTEVDLTVYYLGPNQAPIFEKTHYPVLVTSFSLLGDANAPLKPGYSRKFEYSLDGAPTEWTGNVNARVTSVAFEK